MKNTYSTHLLSLLFIIINFYSFGQSSCPTSFTVSSTDETSYGACDGTITFYLTGGTPDFIYTVTDTSNSLNTFTDTSNLSVYTFTNLCPGTYECIVTDTSGVFCPGNGIGSGSTYATINAAASTLSVSCDVIGINCWYDQGDVSATVTGNAPPFLYSLNGGPWTTSSYFTGATVGCVMVSIDVQDATGQIASTFCSPYCYWSPVPLSTVTSPPCSIGCNGEAYIIIDPNDFSSGTPPYTIYVQNTNVGVISLITDTIFLTGLCSGIYNVNSAGSQVFCPSFYGSFTITEQNISSTIDTTACNSYISPSGNYTWTTSGNYSDTLINTFGCDSIININLSINTVDSSVTQNGINLSANQTGASYQWVECPAMTPISGATSQSYTATANGDYAVIVTYSGCVDTSLCYTVSSVNIIENDFGNELIFYPNPSDGNFTIDLGDNYEYTMIKLTDLNGKLIETNYYKNIQYLHLKIEEPVGIYLLNIETESKKAIIKLIKE